MKLHHMIFQISNNIMKKKDILEISDSSFKFENFFNVYETDKGYRFFNLLKNISIFPSNNSEVEEEYIADGTDTWYSISHKIYGTLNLWWLVCLYNGTINPFTPLKSKTVLKVLKGEYVGLVLSEIKKQIL
jgi:hypothetical protein